MGRQVDLRDFQHDPALKYDTGKWDIMVLNDLTVLTICQLQASPYRLVHPQLIVSVELFVQLPAPLPLSVLHIWAFTLGCSCAGAFLSRGVVYTGVRDNSTTSSAAEFPSIRSKCAILRNRICTYFPELSCGLEVS